MAKSNLGGNQILQKAFDETKSALKVNNLGSLVPAEFDYISVAYPVATQEVYTYKLGGVGGATVATVTINYVDASKEAILNVSRA